MSQWQTVPMLISGGLFAGGTAWIAWRRVPAWRAADLAAFRTAFARTLRRADRFQPALLAAYLAATPGPPPAPPAHRARWPPSPRAAR